MTVNHDVVDPAATHYALYLGDHLGATPTELVAAWMKDYYASTNEDGSPVEPVSLYAVADGDVYTDSGRLIARLITRSGVELVLVTIEGLHLVCQVQTDEPVSSLKLSDHPAMKLRVVLTEATCDFTPAMRAGLWLGAYAAKASDGERLTLLSATREGGFRLRDGRLMAAFKGQYGECFVLIAANTPEGPTLFVRPFGEADTMGWCSLRPY